MTFDLSFPLSSLILSMFPHFCFFPLVVSSWPTFLTLDFELNVFKTYSLVRRGQLTAIAIDRNKFSVGVFHTALALPGY